jgi:hypothetical protein
MEFKPCMPNLGQGFCNTTKVQRITGIAKGLQLGNSKRLTVNLIQNQQRNRIALDETSIASPHVMAYDFSTYRPEAELR